MNRVASPQDLQTELRRLLAYSQSPKPSREKLAAEIRELATRIAAPYPPNTLDKFPSGKWGFVGRVDVRLMWETKDGKELSPEEAKDAAEHTNPAMAYSHRVFRTPLEAILAAKKLNQMVTLSPGHANDPEVQEAVKKSRHPHVVQQKA